MLERDRGAVVTIASAAGLTGVARQTDYSASKWAAVGFTESLRSELRAEGSRVGTLVVCPFYINTRSEEHTSELQSRGHLVCRLLLEKKKTSENISTRFL